MTKKAKAFKVWTSDEVEKEFNIERVYQLDLMDEWLKKDRTTPVEWLPFFTRIKDELAKKVEYLNEEELKVHYLVPILDLINFDDFGRYRTFLGRQLSAEKNGFSLNGEVDFMVATGKLSPEKPFFFLHEYKQELKRDNDPKGQLLIAMLVAQTLNKDEKPIYGCYIVGRLVFLVIYTGDKYCVSKAFDMTGDDIYDLVVVLQKSKEMIIKEIDALSK
jgi:hypothetical protein